MCDRRKLIEATLCGDGDMIVRHHSAASATAAHSSKDAQALKVSVYQGAPRLAPESLNKAKQIASHNGIGNKCRCA